MKRRILIVEDNPEIAELIRLHLDDMEVESDVATDGAQALVLAEGRRHDLVILDLMLPELDGLEVCRRLRAGDRYVPIIMLTARGTELDRVLGLEMGADDYLTKPFSIPELLARVRAQFRRQDALAQEGTAEESPLQRGALTIEPARRRVTLSGREVELTAREFDLLLHFARHPGRVFSRASLLDQVWGHGYEGYEHTVNSHINRLRAKIEADPARPRYILTVWGVGYKFRDRED
ncbi:MAG TPA: response regulator transcription factor [Gammaproteobacteria bacterium]|nr:response regulator transcription factor [Gammaproteobacteria bacterium]